MAGKVKASELSVGDRVRVSIMGEEKDVELMQVEREESDGDEVVVFRLRGRGRRDLAPLAAGRGAGPGGLLDWRAWPRSDM